MANPFANSVKFLKAVDLLASPKGATIKEMVESLEISRRSVFRLLEALQELGFPLTNEQPLPREEKTYRLMESYILKLPNLAILNPGFSKSETELLLSMLDFCLEIQKSETVIILNGIRQKILSMKPAK